MDEEEAIVMEINEKAGQIVETAIHNAVEYLENLQMRQQMALEEPRTCPEKEQSYAIKNINWTSCEEFTVNNGIQQIEDYISTWEFHESWLHCTDFLHEEELEFCKRYHYRMNWSLPTCRKPIPRAIASIYFIIEISKVKPCTFPVEVFFYLESNRLEHRPGTTRFREKWLKDIIETKINLMESIFF
ncbi:A-kinase anchor protein 14 isoform X2 [Ambystoma mexicanum]|uniref:A-kinase anchor protein 14 isoform X2 n=1 Tax=Ambystoma mexicanum TaxID=8296 RepID=UPI0037E79832